MKKTRLLFLALGLLVLFLAGCGTSGEKNGEAATGGEEKITIGFSQHRVAGSDWYKMLIDGAEYQAEKEGVELLFTDAGGDALQQNSDIQLMLTKGADGIVVNALDPRGIAGTVEDLEKEGIPFVAVNTRLGEDLEKKSYGYVAEDQLATAAQVGEELAKMLASKYKEGEKVKVAVIGGYSGESTTALRLEGFETGFNGYFEKNPGPEVEVLPIRYGEWLPDRAREPVQQLATANPDLKAVFSMSDVMYPGIEQGLKEAGILDKVVVMGYDGDSGLVKEMSDNPNGPVQATISNTPFLQGAQAVKVAVEAVKGNENYQKGKVYFTDSVLITPKNAAEYYDESKPYYYADEALENLK